MIRGSAPRHVRNRASRHPSPRSRRVRERQKTRLLEATELAARISATLRRSPVMRDESAGRLRLGHVVVDFVSHQVVTPDGGCVHLTPKEFNLLGFLAAHANQVLSDRELLQAVWGPEYGTEHERLHVIVRQVRKKIEADPSRPVFVLTIPRVGYQLALSRGT